MQLSCLPEPFWWAHEAVWENQRLPKRPVVNNWSLSLENLFWVLILFVFIFWGEVSLSLYGPGVTDPLVCRPLECWVYGRVPQYLALFLLLSKQSPNTQFPKHWRWKYCSGKDECIVP